MGGSRLRRSETGTGERIGVGQRVYLGYSLERIFALWVTDALWFLMLYSVYNLQRHCIGPTRLKSHEFLIIARVQRTI